MPQTAPPIREFRIVDMIAWPVEAQREYECAREAGDRDACDALLERYESILRPARIARRRRWSARQIPRCDVLVISQILDESDQIDDEPDPRERTARDGSALIVSTPQTEPAAHPNEVAGFDPFGYPETRAQRVERLKTQAARRS